MFGDPVRGPVEDVTPTYLRSTALATLRQADLVAYDVLVRHGRVCVVCSVCVCVWCAQCAQCVCVLVQVLWSVLVRCL